MPTSLAELLDWYWSELKDALPIRLHQRDLDDGGAPDWHPRFRAWLTAPAYAVDREGYVVDPLRFFLWRMERDEPERARFLMLLPAWGWQWDMAAHVAGVAPDSCQGAIRALFRRMYTVSRDVEGRVVITPNQPYRSSRGECEQEGCTATTNRRWCREHAKSDAQIDAETLTTAVS